MKNITQEQAVDEAVRKAVLNTSSPLDHAMLAYYRAKQDFEILDGISRTRALSEGESRALERAMNRMQDWAVRQ